MARLPRHRARWWLNLYPEAGEASGSFKPSIPRREFAERDEPIDPQRAKREADRRAAAKLRRYCAANGLDRLGTLTYTSPCFDTLRLRLDVAGFFKRLRRELGGERFPYAWVQEWHPGGHGLHIHFAVGRFVPYTVVVDAWGRGIVDIRRVTTRNDSATATASARAAGRYLAKYVAKAVPDGPAAAGGTHRYEVAQGYQPRAVCFSDRSPEAVIARASAEMGAPPTYIWHSASHPGWDGPPSCWCTW